MATVLDATRDADYDGAPNQARTVDFMRQVEGTVRNVLQVHGPSTNIHDLPPDEREAVLISRCLQGRLDDAERLGVCHRCWLQQAYCFCAQCPPLDEPLSWGRSDVGGGTSGRRGKCVPSLTLRRLFLIMHYREIFMAVDTAKLIMAALPQSTRLVVSGIPSKYQESMAELEEALAQAKSPKKRGNFLILFPDDAAKTFDTIVADQRGVGNDYGTHGSDGSESENQQYDIVVIDGTWQQARRMKLRYFPPGSATRNPSLPPQTVKLGPAALELMQQLQNEHAPSFPDGKSGACDGHQLRKHSVEWKKIATFEAVRLFLADLLQGQSNHDNNDEEVEEVAPPWIQIKGYLRIANEAALNRKGKGW
jgi:DTW domain-containing protein YfiP